MRTSAPLFFSIGKPKAARWIGCYFFFAIRTAQTLGQDEWNKVGGMMPQWGEERDQGRGVEGKGEEPSKEGDKQGEKELNRRGKRQG